jgi:hypothetical protein
MLRRQDDRGAFLDTFENLHLRAIADPERDGVRAAVKAETDAYARLLRVR